MVHVPAAYVKIDLMGPQERFLELSRRNGERLSHPPPGEEVVISGISGCFPESDNLYEFRDNLLNKVDMVSAQDPDKVLGSAGFPKRLGKLKPKLLSKFDASFFGIPSIEAEIMDPMSRMALEKTYEAIADAGVNPLDLKGKNVGVYVSTCVSETERHVCYEIVELNGFGVTGTERTGMANKISRWLKVNGPSMVVDTACSSSLYALNTAYEDVRDGIVDKAVVTGLNVLLTTTLTKIFVRLGVVGKEGVCRAFDDDASGYVRGEAICVIFLQKAKDSKRVYATVVHSKTNSDGYKSEGITFPSSEGQQILLKEVYKECNVDPATVDYVEAHGTGTEVGDPEELLTIENVFCPGREGPLSIGSLKSNIGHSEGAAGASSIAKVVLCMELGVLLPNLHYNTPHRNVEALKNGKLEVVTDVIPWKGTTAAINSFGFGGSNCHLLLRCNPKSKVDGGRPADNIPRLVVASGRNLEGVISFLEDVESYPVDAEYVNLLHSLFSRTIPHHPYRGYTILAAGKKYKKTQLWSEERPPVWFVISGLGSQWPGMGSSLLEIPAFAETVKKCDKILKPLGVDVYEILCSHDSHIFDMAVNCFVGIAVMQIGLVDVLTALRVVPDGIIGHSIGELVCAYADGTLTLKETVLVAYYHGLACSRFSLPKVALAIVHMNYKQILHRLPKNIELVGADNESSCVIAGPTDHLKNFTQNLKVTEGTEVKLLSIENIPCHTRHMEKIQPKLIQYLKEVFPYPKPRSNKWVSQSDVQSKVSSAEYFANNLLNRVLFSEARKQIPEDAVLLEISPKNVVSDLNLTLHEQKEEGAIHLLETLGRLYSAGIDLDLAKLYPAVLYPVSRGTPMISPHIKWQHNQEWYVLNKCTGIKGASGHADFTVNVSEDEFAFYTGHVVDRRNLFPATGYLFLVWQVFGTIQLADHASTSITFKNVKFHRATHLPKDGTIRFTVMIQASTGNFEVMESNTTIVTGNISILKKSVIKPKPVEMPTQQSEDKDQVDFTAKDIYKELRLRGYQYSGLFRSLVKANQERTYGEVCWCDNWVAFLDNILQMKILSIDSRGLYVPTSIEELSIDVITHEEIIEELGDNQVIPIHANNLLNIITCGGVEIRGIKANPIARKRPLGEPVLEHYQFVPFHVIDSSAYSLCQTLSVCVHTFLENNELSKLDVAELVPHQKNMDSQILAPLLSTIIGNLPVMKADITLYGDPEDLRIKELETPVKVEVGSLKTNQKYHVIVACNLTQNTDVFESVVESLHQGGCIISREQPSIKRLEKYRELDVVVDHLVGKERIIMFKKKHQEQELAKSTTIINVTETNFDWLPQIQAAVKESEPHKRIVLVAQGEPLNGILGLYNCLHREPGGAIVRCFVILDEDAPPFDPLLPSYRAQLDKDLAVNVLKDGQWGSYRHHLFEKLSLTDASHSFVNTAVYGDLSSLTWFQGSINSLTSKPSPEGELVHIYYSALNFRDVMLTTGRLAMDVALPNRLDQDCIIGFEFSGRNSKGERVMGTVNKGALSSVIMADPDLLWTIPEHWSLQDAATVPVVYGTVLCALCVSTQVKKGESILIHAGTGGIGLAAIYLSLHFGLTIFTTVGTQEKRDYIRKHFPQIPERNIGNSRDTTFEHMVMRETGGKGVDLILNSLSEEKLQASVRCLAKGGRFLEIGKFDLAANNQIAMDHFLKNISYHGIMLDLVYRGNTDSKKQFQHLLQEAIDSGAVQPLKSCSIFEENEVEQAFRYMAAGKHIGKVLIKLRDEEPQQIVTPTVKIMQARPRFYCDAELTYIILGGLGGFGLELADWLVLRGAKQLVLTSRRGIVTGYQSSRVNTWRGYGVKVLICTQDVSTEQGVRQLLTEASALAPVGGIFNLAVVLHDALLVNQTIQQFEESSKGKAIATRHLDILTRQMCPQLEQFVVFSSVSCGRGNAGQTNYGMSNSVMERICEARVRDGLPGLAVQWGAIGEVGLVADMQEDNKELVIGGTLQQTIGSCLEALDGFLRQTYPVVASMVVAEKLAGDGADNLAECVLGILGIRDIKKLSPNATLSELGMDSMSGVEVKQTLERDFELFLSPIEIRDLTVMRLLELSQVKKENTTEESENEKGADFLNVIGLDAYSKEVLNSVHMDYPLILQLPSLGNNNTPVFMIPGLEGLASTLVPLSGRLNSQTFALQLYNWISVPEIGDMVDVFMPFVKAKLNDGVPLQLIGFSFGGLLGAEMLALLEEAGYHGKMVFIDSSPDVMKDGIQPLFKNGEEAFQIMFLMHFLMNWKVASPSNSIKFVEECKAIASWDGRLDWFINKIRPHFEISPDHIKAVTNSTINRCKAVLHYTWQHEKQLTSRVMLLRPSVKLLNMEDDYKLSKYFKNVEAVHYIEGDHLTILDHPDTAEYINKFFESD